MSNYQNTKATIAANVYTNHNNEVTAAMVKAGINSVVDSLIAGGFLYKGVATTSTNPGSPDANVFYIATAPGTYTNFGSLVVADGEVAILKYNGSWSKEVTGAATAAEVTALGQEVNGFTFRRVDISGMTWNTGYRNANNYSINTSSLWKYSDPFFVKKGSIVCFNNWTTANTISLLGEISQDGTKYIKTLCYVNGNRAWASILIEKDMYIEVVKSATDYADRTFYIYELNADIFLDLSDSIRQMEPWDVDAFELGNLVAKTSTPPEIQSSTSRICTKIGKTIPFVAGDTISVPSGVRFYLMWYGASGWNSVGWKTSYTITEDGDYYIIARSNPEATIADAAVFAKNIVVTHYNGKQDQLISGTTIKSLNGASLLGSGNISLRESPLRYYGVKNIAHRGYMPSAIPGNDNPPENTPYALVKAKQLGFDAVEIDVNFTSDHVPIVLHDTSINRTARNSDGTEIGSTINIRSITYAQAQTYDFGIAYGSRYAGTKIPTFAEMVEVARNLGLEMMVEIKNGTTEEIELLAPIADKAGMLRRISWMSDNVLLTRNILTYDSIAYVGFLNTTGAAITDTQYTNISTYLDKGNNRVFVLTNYADETAAEDVLAHGYDVGYYMVNDETAARNAPIAASMLESNIIPPSQLLKDAMEEDWPIPSV